MPRSPLCQERFTPLRRWSVLAYVLVSLLAGCGTFFSLEAEKADPAACRPLTYGGTRADLGTLISLDRFEDDPYHPCTPEKDCGVVGTVGARVFALVDLPLSVFLDTFDLFWTAPLDIFIQYHRYNHLAVGGGPMGYTCRAEAPANTPAPAPVDPTHFGPYAGTAAACAAVRGRWAPFGPTTQYYCVVPTADGGRACQDTADCQGFCVASLGPATPVAPGARVAGVCAASFQQPCFQYVLKGVAQPRICQASASPSVAQ